MINITLFHIESWDLVKFQNIWSKDFGRVPFTTNKYLEMQLMRDGMLLGLELDIQWKGQCHAGPKFSIAFLTFHFEITIYDNRHWHYDEDRWEAYPGEGDKKDEDATKVFVYDQQGKTVEKKWPT